MYSCAHICEDIIMMGGGENRTDRKRQKWSTLPVEEQKRKILSNNFSVKKKDYRKMYVKTQRRKIVVSSIGVCEYDVILISCFA
jgi:hypothetical protein